MKQNFTIRQGALDGVEAFLSVARHRSFRKAAAELGVTPSAMSQAVRALEVRVGAALFIRTTRSVGLTEAGERFLSRAKPAFEELVAASEVARDLGQRPAGLLRLTVPRAVVPILLEPLIASFSQAFPEVEVEIAASGELVDLAAGGYDAGDDGPNVSTICVDMLACAFAARTGRSGPGRLSTATSPSR
jgi:DNA-binding transcriptional LysR family regulator